MFGSARKKRVLRSYRAVLGMNIVDQRFLMPMVGIRKGDRRSNRSQHEKFVPGGLPFDVGKRIRFSSGFANRTTTPASTNLHGTQTMYQVIRKGTATEWSIKRGRARFIIGSATTVKQVGTKNMIELCELFYWLRREP
ncbi:AAEL008460-PA [Aedes aegypti]|uniref:AAEL008460-PA n=1 Tax=Aedes aegypti TaxID=7159 RepID=Q16YQ6_AEDAE|nr:AAEL008460-PA [Aedes aegypti]